MDGCITNDGDAFLYGARTVYKDLSTSEVRLRYSGIITSSSWYCHHHRLAICQNWLSISASQSVASVEQRAASTSFPGSFILGKKDPGSGWSRASQKWEVTKKMWEGEASKSRLLSFLNSLWKGQICVKI